MNGRSKAKLASAHVITPAPLSPAFHPTRRTCIHTPIPNSSTARPALHPHPSPSPVCRTETFKKPLPHTSLQPPRRSRNLSQMIPVQLLQPHPHPLMAIILLIPLILTVLDLPLPIQRQRHQAMDFLRRRREARLVFLLHLERQRGGVGEHDLGGERARGGHDFGYAFACC